MEKDREQMHLFIFIIAHNFWVTAQVRDHLSHGGVLSLAVREDFLSPSSLSVELCLPSTAFRGGCTGSRPPTCSWHVPQARWQELLSCWQGLWLYPGLTLGQCLWPWALLKQKLLLWQQDVPFCLFQSLQHTLPQAARSLWHLCPCHDCYSLLRLLLCVIAVIQSSAPGRTLGSSFSLPSLEHSYWELVTKWPGEEQPPAGWWGALLPSVNVCG